MNQPVHLRPRMASARPAPKPAALAAKASDGRSNDPERTMAHILDVALTEFAEKGLAGARIDEIAAATQTSKRMICQQAPSQVATALANMKKNGMQVSELPPAELAK